MTRNEHEYYANINGIAKALDRIANALENNNEVAHNVKHAFTGMDGTDIQDKYANKAVNRILEGSIDNEELDTQHDYLHQLVQDLDNERYHEFCNLHCIRSNDAVEVSNYITDLDYDEVLGIIKEIEAANEDDKLIKDNDNVKYRENYIMCPDLDLRETARMYVNELEHGHFSTKKECILDYITNEFGSQGARYTDIIKFAYYLNHSNGSKFDSIRDRGYYSLGISGRNPYLIRGGKDFLVKGINKEGDERYFAHSFVESVTDYWKYINK